MKKKKSETTMCVQRIAALNLNPYFREEVRVIREKYNIPSGPGVLKGWWSEHIMPYNRTATAYFIFNLIGKSLPNHWAKKAVKNLEDTEVPVERDVIRLLRRFSLPNFAFYHVLQFILSDNDVSWIGQIFKPHVFTDKVLYETRSKQLKKFIHYGMDITIAKIPVWFTKKDWIGIWDSHIGPQLTEARRGLLKGHSNAGSGISRKSTVSRIRNQISRWAEWYQLSEIKGFGPARALKKWEEENPDEAGKYDQSTVTKAIKEFSEIITPLD